MKRMLVVLAILATACAGETAATTTTTSPPTTTSRSPTTTTTVATTATTAIASTTSLDRGPSGESVAGSVDGTVGYVGCSMSQNAAEGYQLAGGDNMWSFRAPYGGGTIGRWNDDITSDRGRYWGGFAKELDLSRNTTIVWWNLCTAKAGPHDSYENAVLILDEIQAQIPGVVVYVSAQPAYTDGHACELAGPGGPEAMQEIADQLIAEGLVLEGPRMGPLQKSETRDGCHANEDGMEVLGQQLLDFFG